MSTDKNLWMGDVQPWMDDSFIMNAFNFYNFFPKSIKLIHDKLTGELKNFCFINFQTIEEANNCLSNLSGKIIPNTQIKFKLNWANYFSNFNRNFFTDFVSLIEANQRGGRNAHPPASKEALKKLKRFPLEEIPFRTGAGRRDCHRTGKVQHL